jgi:ribosomal protein S12 methylthiotransferase
LRSRNRRDILKEVEILTKNGVKEINIIAQDIGNYGQDFGKNYDFLTLLNDICKIKKDGWIRLLYLHPRHIDEKFVDLMSRNKQICRYLDMPIQHISDKILKLMNRPITKRDVLDKISLLRQNIPDMILRTTLIIGFPSETDKEFDELVEFVGTGDVEKIGIFKYSKEPGTKAYALKNHVPEKIKDKRFEILTKIYEDVSFRNQYKFIDKEMKVLVEYKDKSTYQSRFYGMAPEVDGNIFFSSKKKIQIGSFVKIKIKDVNAYDMFGEFV